MDLVVIDTMFCKITMTTLSIILGLTLVAVGVSPLYGNRAGKLWWAAYLLVGLPLTVCFVLTAWIFIWMRAEHVAAFQRGVPWNGDCPGKTYLVASLAIFLAAAIFIAITVIKWQAEKREEKRVQRMAAIATVIISGVLCNAIWHTLVIVWYWR